MTVEEDLQRARIDRIEQRLEILEGNDEQFDARVAAASTAVHGGHPVSATGEVVEPTEDDEDFDPSDHTVSEVNDRLADSSEDERSRILDAEEQRSGGGRAGILQGPYGR